MKECAKSAFALYCTGTTITAQSRNESDDQQFRI